MKSLEQYITESEDMIEEYPSLLTLGDGVYSGTMGGWIFTYEGQNYKCDFGVRGRCCPITIKVENNKMFRL